MSTISKSVAQMPKSNKSNANNTNLSVSSIDFGTLQPENEASDLLPKRNRHRWGPKLRSEFIHHRAQ